MHNLGCQRVATASHCQDFKGHKKKTHLRVANELLYGIVFPILWLKKNAK